MTRKRVRKRKRKRKKRKRKCNDVPNEAGEAQVKLRWRALPGGSELQVTGGGREGATGVR